MSLSALALRVITVRALTGATWANAAVFDSEIGVIDQIADKNRAPFLLVYTDDEKQQVRGKALFGEGDTRKLKLVIEAVVAEPAKVDTAAGGGQGGLTIPSTDANREMCLDMLRRQICAALVNPRNAWAELWREIVANVETIDVTRGADNQGVRFAAKQITFTLDTLGEPAPGEGLAYGWDRIVEKLEADADLAGYGAFIRAACELPEGLGDWEIAQAQLGLTAAGVKALGIVPLAVDANGTAAPLSEFVIEAQTEPPIANPPAVSSNDPGLDPPAS